VTTGVIAIDGPSGAGKSTVARGVATALGWRYLDTGSMYRAATLAVLDELGADAPPDRVAEVVAGAAIEVGTDPARPEVRLASRDVARRVRSAAVDSAVSAVSANPEVRRIMVDRQRAIMAAGDIVIEGRDIGTVVAPDATVKVFLTASADVRAQRRAAQSAGAGARDVADTQTALEARDATDRARRTSPLTRADDAHELDTDRLSADEAVAAILSLHGRTTRRATRRATGRATRPAAPVSPRRPTSLVPEFSPRFFLVTSTLLRWVCRLIFTVRVRGAERVPAAGAALLVGNHRGFLDGPLVALFVPRPASFLAKSELFRGPLADFLGRCGQIPVDRGRPDRTALRRAGAVLSAGGVLGMFPEGTRGSGRLESVQHGVGYVALRAACPIVPVACLGTERALPKGRPGRLPLPRFGSRIDIVFGEPFLLDGAADPHARRAVGEAAEQIRRRVAAHLAEAEVGRR
jgi:cytidylate kinase